MSNDEQLGTQPATTRAGSWMTPQASAIAGFTLAALALTGQGAWTALAQAFFGSNFAQGSLGAVLASGFLAALVVEGIALLLARQALTHASALDAWVVHLARAAVILAFVGGAFWLLALVASLVLANG